MPAMCFICFLKVLFRRYLVVYYFLPRIVFALLNSRSKKLFVIHANAEDATL
jgi:hypothetical protein